VNGVPPIIDAAPRQPRWRWAIHLALLASYVLGIGLIGSQTRHYSDTQSALPRHLNGLAWMCFYELVFFVSIFALALVFSRARARDLFLEWRGGVRPIFWGAVYSVALRFAVMIVVILLVVPVVAMKGQKSVEKLRPKIENVIDMEAIKDPAYLIFTLTVVSFVVAGLREELWRAGMIAGLAGLAPRWFSSQRGQYAAVVLAAIVFGIGHLPQGWGGVFLTSLLGIGLGTIMVWRKSVWEAAIAHGFFDATSFAALYVIAKYLPGALHAL
jgi:hypothetical protein